MKKQLFIRKAMKADDENGMQASELSSSTFILISYGAVMKKKVSIDPKCKPSRMHTMIAEQTVLECLPCSVFQGA